MNALDPRQPTAALPGTAEKVEVLRQRAALRLPLFHPDDATTATRQTQVGLSSRIRDLPTGVIYLPERKVYRVRVNVNGVRVHLGYFRTLAEAIQAVQVAQEKSSG